MKAGLNDQLVYFEYPETVNNAGDVSTTWHDASGNSPRAPDYAQVLTQKGNEAFEAARVQSKSTIRCMVRFRSDVKTTWRVEWESEKYNIVEIDRSKRRDGELWFTAEILEAQ